MENDNETTTDELPFLEVKRTVKTPLTPEERAELGGDLAKLYTEKAEIEAEAKAEAKHYKDRKGGVEAKIQDASELLIAGHRLETVDCEWRWNVPKKGKATLFRQDTEAIVDTRPMTADEKATSAAIAETFGEEGGAE